MLFTVKKREHHRRPSESGGHHPHESGCGLSAFALDQGREVLTIMATDANIEFTGTYPAE